MRSLARSVAVGAVLGLAITSCTATPATTTDTTSGTSTTTTTTSLPTTTTTLGPAAEMASLQSRFAATPMRVTYLIGAEGIEATLSQDPSASPPVAAVIVEQAHAHLITIGAQTFFCDTAAPACFEVEGTTQLPTSLLGPLGDGLALAAGLELIPGITRSEDEVVAGRDGRCFSYAPPSGSSLASAAVRHCVDAELGFTLLLEDDSGAAAILRLIDFGEPVAGDFDPPGPVEATS